MSNLRNGKVKKVKKVNEENSDDSTDDEGDVSKRVDKQIRYCLNMKPESGGPTDHIKAKLNGIISDKISTKSTIGSGKKKIDGLMTDFSSDLARLNSNFEILLSCINDLLPRLELINSLQERVSHLEEKLNSQRREYSSFFKQSSQTSIPTVATDSNASFDKGYSKRLDKLEYLSSEKERERRIL